MCYVSVFFAPGVETIISLVSVFSFAQPRACDVAPQSFLREASAVFI